MNLVFELSKEHKTIPSAEVLACLNAIGVETRVIESNNDAIVIGIDDAGLDVIDILAHRLSFTYSINELLFISPVDVEEIRRYALDNSIPYQGSVAIRYRNRSRSIPSHLIINAIADVYTTGRVVNLEEPMIEVRVLITDDKVYTGIKKKSIDRGSFEERKVQYRPFFSPISLHPRLARALVNLSCIKPGEILLDPFCGTGGILLEAGLIGAYVIGSDIQEKMITGCRQTLDHYDITSYRLYCIDIGEVSRYVDLVDAVVTDLPYGKATTTRGEDTDKLYERAFQSISNILKDDKRAVIGAPTSSIVDIGRSYLHHIETHKLRVHKSLTRYFTIYKK